MPSSEEYLLYVQELLREVDGISCKRMMGEYLLYRNGTLFGGVYDDRFLVKKTKSLENKDFKEVIPYPNAKPMLLVDIEDAEEIENIINLIVGELKR